MGLARRLQAPEGGGKVTKAEYRAAVQEIKRALLREDWALVSMLASQLDLTLSRESVD